MSLMLHDVVFRSFKHFQQCPSEVVTAICLCKDVWYFQVYLFSSKLNSLENNAKITYVGIYTTQIPIHEYIHGSHTAAKSTDLVAGVVTAACQASWKLRNMILTYTLNCLCHVLVTCHMTSKTVLFVGRFLKALNMPVHLICLNFILCWDYCLFFPLAHLPTFSPHNSKSPSSPSPSFYFSHTLCDVFPSPP